MTRTDPHTDPHHGLHDVLIKTQAARQALEEAHRDAVSRSSVVAETFGIEARQSIEAITNELRGTFDGPWWDLEWITPKDILTSVETAVFLADYPAGWQIMVKALEATLLRRADFRTR